MTAPMMKSVTKARRPKAVDVAANSRAVADHEAAAEADQGDQAGKRPEDQDDRLPVKGVAGGEVSAEGPDGVADGEQREAPGDDDGHDLRAEIVGGQDLKLGHVPPDQSGEGEENECDDEACHVDAPLGR